MPEIIPAIIGQDFTNVLEKINRVEGLVTWAQLDIMDSTMTAEFSWANPSDLAQVEGQIKLEAHLMVKDPEEIVEDWVNHCDRIILHLESSPDLQPALEIIKRSACEPAIALLLQTPLESLEKYIDHVKTVQLMAIATIGHHGEPLDESVYERIKSLRQKYPSVKINIDGGVTLENARKLIAAGADGLVVGSALWQASDLPGAIDALRRTN